MNCPMTNRPTDVSCPDNNLKLNERIKQPNECKANERPNKRRVERLNKKRELNDNNGKENAN